MAKQSVRHGKPNAFNGLAPFFTGTCEFAGQMGHQAEDKSY